MSTKTKANTSDQITLDDLDELQDQSVIEVCRGCEEENSVILVQITTPEGRPFDPAESDETTGIEFLSEKDMLIHYCADCLKKRPIPNFPTERERVEAGNVGRPRLGFEVNAAGEYVPNDEYDEICDVLQQAHDGEISINRASEIVDCSWDAVRRALSTDDLYELDE